jgi:hypothetical protein
MTPSKLEKHDAARLNELARDITDLKVAVQLIQEKQDTHVHRHDGLKECLSKLEQALEKRLHELENFKLLSLQRLSNMKTIWPILLAGVVIVFSFAVFVDDKAVAAKIVNAVEEKHEHV